MINITQEQARKRFVILPPTLQSAVFSSRTAEVIDRLAVDNHLDDDKAGLVAEVAGLVLMGFVHPEDAAREIREALDVKPEIAQGLAEVLQKRIFAPLSADITQAYAAPLEEIVISPRVEEIKQPGDKSVVETGEEPAGTKIDETLSKIHKTAGPMPVFFGEKAAASVAATAPISSTSPTLPTAPTLEGPTPIFIHEESSAKPISSASKFRLKIPSLFKFGKPPVPLPPKPAELEITGEKTEPRIVESKPPAASLAESGPLDALGMPSVLVQIKNGVSVSDQNGPQRIIHYGPSHTPLASPTSPVGGFTLLNPTIGEEKSPEDKISVTEIKEPMALPPKSGILKRIFRTRQPKPAALQDRKDKGKADEVPLPLPEKNSNIKPQNAK